MLATTSEPRVRLAERTTDELEQRLHAIESMISKARALEVDILRELEARQVPAWDGTCSLKEWIAGRLDMKPAGASDLALLAKSDQVVILERLAAGEMTLDRAAETTRLANTGADAATIDKSRGVTVTQVTQLAARQRRMTSWDETNAFNARRLWVQPNLDNTLAIGTFAMPGAHVDAFLQGLDERADRIVDRDDPLIPRAEQRRLDALMSLALDETAPQAADGVAPRRLKAHIFVEAETVRSTGGEAGAITRSGIKVGPNTLREIFCSGETQTSVVHEGQLKAVNTDSDRLPQRMRDFIFYRDGGCTADGCTSRYRLEPHHILERSRGGSDDPRNLTLLCWFHHHVVVHQRGFRIDPESPPGRRRFLRPGMVRGPPGR